MKKNNIKANAANPADDVFTRFLQMMPENKEFMFRFLDSFPVSVEIYAPDGTHIFINKTRLKLNNIPYPGFVVGKYNILNDPVINDQMGMRDYIQRAFKGEPVVAYDVIAPMHYMEKSGVFREKPFEKPFMDFHLYPVMNGKELVFVIFVCNVKELYYRRPEPSGARE